MSDVVGIQAVRAALRNPNGRARCLYISKGRRDARMNELIGMARDLGVRFQTVEPAFFKRRCEAGVAHQGVLLECQQLRTQDEHALLAHLQTIDQPLLLVLDGVTDPRNMGACLRTANAAGVHAVVLPKRNSAPLSEVALKTAQGGAEDLFLAEVTNLSRTLKALAEANIWLIGSSGDAPQSYSQVTYTQGSAIIVGSEGKGMRRLTRQACDQLVSIPMLGSVSSLNVSVACGVLLFEAQRQRLGG